MPSMINVNASCEVSMHFRQINADMERERVGGVKEGSNLVLGEVYNSNHAIYKYIKKKEKEKKKTKKKRERN